jgi:hypothetical protein
MILRGNERDGLRGEAAKSDLNGDGVITVDELVMHLSAPNAGGAVAPSRPAGTPVAHEADREVVFGQDPHWQSSTSTGTGSGPADENDNERPKFYRFRSPKERLPEGLPGFFSRDANGDGQVSMSEYSRYWSDRTVEEFRRYDTDNDGMITPKECQSRE